MLISQAFSSLRARPGITTTPVLHPQGQDWRKPAMWTPKQTQKDQAKLTLTLHPTGQYCKKHRGKTYYFGSDRKEALERFSKEWADIVAGRLTRSKLDRLSVGDLANYFLNAKRNLIRSADLTPRSWADCHKTCEEMIEVFGRDRAVSDLRPTGFATLRKRMIGRLGPVAMGNFIQRVRTVFKFGFDAEVLAVPVRFGPQFAKPKKRAV